MKDESERKRVVCVEIRNALLGSVAQGADGRDESLPHAVSQIIPGGSGPHCTEM